MPAILQKERQQTARHVFSEPHFRQYTCASAVMSPSHPNSPKLTPLNYHVSSQAVC
jgi:hypothetical protein